MGRSYGRLFGRDLVNVRAKNLMTHNLSSPTDFGL